MKTAYLIVLTLLAPCGFCQLTQISTNTSQNLINLSVIDKNIMICGWNGYLVKSVNEANSLSQMTIAGPTGNATSIQRLDSTNIFLLSYSPSQTFLYKSVDGGYNWIQKYFGSGNYSRMFAFFNSLDGLMTSGGSLEKTMDGGVTWTTVPTPAGLYGIDNLKLFGDSTIILGGSGLNAIGGFYLSKNRGSTWSAWNGLGGQGGSPTDFCILSNDTIWGISSPNTSGVSFLTKTVNGGNIWQNQTSPLYAPYGIYFKNKNEGYVIGSNSSSRGFILRTTDFGQTWQSFNTGITTSLLEMAFLNDSIALLTGTNGVLLKWNYKTSIFTGVEESDPNQLSATVWPNPVSDFLNIELHDQNHTKCRIRLVSPLGEVIFDSESYGSIFSIDLSQFSPGVYFLSLRAGQSQKVSKIVVK